jgi:hypothetical protein
LRHFLAVHFGGEEVASRTEVLRDRPLGGQEALGLPWRLEALHASFPLARGLVRVFGAIIEIAMLPMLHARQELSLCRPITGQFVGNNHPWDIPAAFEELAEELFRCDLVAPALDKDI